MSFPRRGDGKLTLEFDQPIKWDLADAKAAMPPTLRSIDTDVEDDSDRRHVFAFNGTPKVRTFREDRSIVVDVEPCDAKPKPKHGDVRAEQRPKPAPAAAAAVPAIAPPETVPAKEAAAEPPPKAAAAPAPPPRRSWPPKPPRRDAAGDAKSGAEGGRGPPRRQPPSRPPPNAKRPAPNPNAPVVVDAAPVRRRACAPNSRSRSPTPAAVFQPRRHAVAGVRQRRQDRSRRARRRQQPRRSAAPRSTRGADGEAIVRIKLERPRLVSLRGRRPGLGRRPSATPSRCRASRSPSPATSSAKTAPASSSRSTSPRKLHRLTDRDVGDRLLVVTALGPARGFLKGAEFRRVARAAVDPGRGAAAARRRRHAGACRRQDHRSRRPSGLSLSPTRDRPTAQLRQQFRAA